MRPFKQVILLQVFLKFEIEYCEKDLRWLRKALGQHARPCMHEKRHLAFVVTTFEEPEELLERLRPSLEESCIEDYTATFVLGGAAGKHGGMNSFVSRINMAFAMLNSGPTKHLTDSQRLIEPYKGKRASREVGVKPRGAR